MNALRQTFWCDKSYHNAPAGIGNVHKSITPIGKQLFVILCNREVFLGEFHFAQMHNLVYPFYYQIDLGASTVIALFGHKTPGRGFGGNT